MPSRVVSKSAPILLRAILFSALFAPAHAILAQRQITGTVRDTTGAGVWSAEVSVSGTPLRAETDESGEFTIARIPSGSITLRVRRLGFRPVVSNVTINAETPTRVAIVLHSTAAELAPVFVRAEPRRRYTGYLAGFNERRDKGFGHFITEDDIRHRNPYRLTDMLRMVPGLAVSPERYRDSRARLRGNTCPPSIWIDGARTSGAEFPLDGLEPSTVTGVEIYSGAATVPPQFASPVAVSACGAIIVWTRQVDPIRKGKRALGPADLERMIAGGNVFTGEQVETQARRDTAGATAPVYPDSLYRARVPGRVVVDFVVDTAGVVIPETLGVVSSPDVLFSESVKRALLEAHYSPAKLHGTSVAQFVRETFEFVVPAPR